MLATEVLAIEVLATEVLATEVLATEVLVTKVLATRVLATKVLVEDSHHHKGGEKRNTVTATHRGLPVAPEAQEDEPDTARVSKGKEIHFMSPDTARVSKGRDPFYEPRHSKSVQG